MTTLHLDKSTRLNVLLTEDRPRGDGHWCQQLSRLLEPQGVHTHLARTGREAIDFAQTYAIHAAVIDMNTPIDATGQTNTAWLLELLGRLPNRPPFIVVTSPMFDQAQAGRVLNLALKAGAFSVLNRPVSLNEMLLVFQRLVDRVYEGSWPDAGGPKPIC